MIAISYRRQDSSPVAGRLYDRLQAEFGKDSVFMDFDSIPYGVDFREHIKQTLRRAKVVVAIIGPDWAGGKDPADRRIDDPADFVRLEVASALENGIPIIPVLVNNTAMPDAKKLPPELEGLAFRNGLALDTGIDFHHHADRLIAGIHKVIDPAKETTPLPSGAKVEPPAGTAPSAQKKSPLGLIAGLILLIAAGGAAAWYFVGRSPHVTTSTAVQAGPAPTAAIVAKATPPENPETTGDYTYEGTVGPYQASFQLHFEASGRVTGTYTLATNRNLVLRLEGRNPKGKLVLDEYTRDRLTARIELTLNDAANEIRWEGTMYNKPPDNRVFPVSFARPRK
jgi:hypothetical protein